MGGKRIREGGGERGGSACIDITGQDCGFMSKAWENRSGPAYGVLQTAVPGRGMAAVGREAILDVEAGDNEDGDNEDSDDNGHSSEHGNERATRERPARGRPNTHRLMSHRHVT